MDDDTIHSCADFGPSYEFCPDADWWKEGISYESAVERIKPSTETLSVLEREFNERAERWEKQSAIHSSPGATYLYRDYIAIMGMGMASPKIVIPLILSRIPNSGADWFFALETIAGENPAKSCQSFDQAYAAWRNWAKDNEIFRD